ncbi:hypothetical protein AVEN_179753-1 [Araneus ventricosus]|uniref:Uncharacterized protein n=1 Tax=Araneus ventricosus TaxID=182803 RepID=A0A4Y2G940_ARAVE|nr:hypothetical protein AVEN_179753-1 [Araneus ventricosus]
MAFGFKRSSDGVWTPHHLTRAENDEVRSKTALTFLENWTKQNVKLDIHEHSILKPIANGETGQNLSGVEWKVGYPTCPNIPLATWLQQSLDREK